MLSIDVSVAPAFNLKVDDLVARLPVAAREAMDSAMQNQADRARAFHAERSGTDHNGVYTTWLLPGVYPDGAMKGKRGDERFRWQATGLTEKSIQGYAVGVGFPHDVGSVVDVFGRTHSSSVSVAPIPSAGPDEAVGVLTMTTTYAPPESVSSVTEGAGFEEIGYEEGVGTILGSYHGGQGVQGYELNGSPDGHIRGTGTVLTVASLEWNKEHLVAHLRAKLEEFFAS